jgi:hypothetical protein
MNITPRTGEYVRVVLEGHTGSLGGYDGKSFTLGNGPDSCLVNPNCQLVKSVEVLREPFKVGDALADKNDLAELPVGAVFISHREDGTTTVFQVKGGWREGMREIYAAGSEVPWSDRDLDQHVTYPVTILWLP